MRCDRAFGTVVAALALGAAGCSGSKDIFATLEIHNDSGQALNEFNLSPSNQQTWGPNYQLPAPIAAGSVFSLTKAPLGQYDARAILADGSKEYLTAFLLEGWKTKAITVVQPTPTTSLSLTGFHAKPSGTTTFGPNVFAGAPLAAGATRYVFDWLGAGSWDFIAANSNAGSYSGNGLAVNPATVKTLVVQSAKIDAGP